MCNFCANFFTFPVIIDLLKQDDYYQGKKFECERASDARSARSLEFSGASAFFTSR